VNVGKPSIRLNSEIHHLACARCGDRIVVKVNRGHGPADDGRAQAQREYKTLDALQSTFPQDGRFGTLVPLGYLEADERGIMITRLFRGTDLARYSRKLALEDVQRTFRSAGAWLRALHEVGRNGALAQTLDIADRLDYLQRTYGSVLHADPAIQDAWGVLERAGHRLETLAVPAVRIHGDFKPENLLCDGVRFVGLDIHLTSVGAAVYDVAPFLNHVWFACHRLWSPRAEQRYELACTGFLSGYGGVGDARVLSWVQLYFALCHLGGYRRRGALASHYANWKVWPLVHSLAGILGNAA
jgi:aminoglycoside phosphotransferase (APT) family kinase protein